MKLTEEGTSHMLERLLGSFPKVIQLLRDDHKLVRSLFAQYAKASNGEKPQIAHRIIRELTIHAAIEERRVYPKAEAHKLDWKGLFEKAQKIKRQPPEKRQKKSRPKSPHPRAA